MKKYTFEQIINERLREFDELDKEATKFNELVSFDKKYEGTNSKYFFDNNELALYYTYSNSLMKELKKRYLRMPWAIHRIDAVFFPSDEQVEHEYRTRNNDLILTVNDVKEFKERLHLFMNSPLVNELRSSYNANSKKIYSLDDKTQLKFSEYYFYLKHNNYEIDFWNQGYIGLVGDSLNAPQILEIFKESTFDSDNFSEYFANRIEQDSDSDLSIEISDNYNLKPYIVDRYGDSTKEYFNIQKNEEAKKLLLNKNRN